MQLVHYIRCVYTRFVLLRAIVNTDNATSVIFNISVGLAPLTIVQETIIVQFYEGSGLGFALAVGLTLGRLVSPIYLCVCVYVRARMYVCTRFITIVIYHLLGILCCHSVSSSIINDATISISDTISSCHIYMLCFLGNEFCIYIYLKTC